MNTPVSVLDREGAGLDYIDNAGGYSRTADQGRVSVRFANGSARIKHRSLIFFSSKPTPGPGSVVLVPTRPGEKTDVRWLIADITQIVATLATLVVVPLRPYEMRDQAYAFGQDQRPLRSAE